MNNQRLREFTQHGLLPNDLVIVMSATEHFKQGETGIVVEITNNCVVVEFTDAHIEWFTGHQVRLVDPLTALGGCAK